MSPIDLNDALEECLALLQSGETLEKVLQRFPQLEDELHPLLLAAMDARAVGQSIEVPVQSQLRSQQAFLRAAAAQPKQAAFPRFSFPHFRFAVNLGIIFIVVAALFGTGLGTAFALPGDALYPVKLAIENVQLNLVPDSANRIRLEEGFDIRRAQETARLMQAGRQVDVTFSGVLDQEKDTWLVAGIRLKIKPGMDALLDEWLGAFVQVQGIIEGDSIRVNSIQPRLFELRGRLEKIQDDNLVLDGLRVNFSNRSHLGPITVGEDLDITAGKLDDGQLVILSINSSKQGESTRTSQPIYVFPSRTPVPAATITPEEPKSPTQKSSPSGTNSPAPTGMPASSTPKATDRDHSDNNRTATPIPPASTPTRTPTPRD